MRHHVRGPHNDESEYICEGQCENGNENGFGPAVKLNDVLFNVKYEVVKEVKNANELKGLKKNKSNYEIQDSKGNFNGRL